MSNVAKLRKQAAELELKKQFDKALAVYIRLLESLDADADEQDIALFNRVGDMVLRQGNVADAVDYYEQAVDRYATGGYFNNAIALCNKILRHSPGRASVYYKLGKISAKKGFTNDAKQNFLEYANRMQKSGKIDEAFRALKEFADLCPDQDDIRLLLADQLSKLNRKDEAIEQLQTLYERFDSEGRSTEAVATAERMRAIDPSVEPRTGGGRRQRTSGDLIFIDLDSSPHSAKAVPERPHPAPRVPPPVEVVPKPEPVVTADETPVSDDLGDSIDPPLSLTEPLTAPELTPVSSPVASAPPSSGLTPVSSPVASESPSIEFITMAAEDIVVDFDNASPPSSMHGVFAELDPVDEDVAGIAPTPAVSGGLISETPVRAMTPASVDRPDFDAVAVNDEPQVSTHRSQAATYGASEPPPGVADDALDVDLDLAEKPSGAKAIRERSITADLEAFDLAAPPVIERPPEPHAPAHALEGVPLIEFKLPGSRDRPVYRPSPLGEMLLADALSVIDDAPSPDEGSDLDADDDDDSIEIPTPSVARRATIMAELAVEQLKSGVEREPDNWELRRQLAEAMLEAGDRASGIHELEVATAGAERAGDLHLASSIADEIARLEPEVVRHQQKRVEYAFLTNDRSRLIDAYLALGDALLQSGQADKARTVYARVLDLAPDEPRARAALDTIEVVEEEASVLPDSQPGQARADVVLPERAAAQASRAPAEAPTRATGASGRAQPGGASSADSFVNLGDWLRDDEAPRDTRMVVDEEEPTGDEEADFADMLRKFKAGVAANVDAEDFQSHYDLAIAYKEMGLLDDAIHEFQKALGSPTSRLPAYEALGQCFMEKEQFRLASSILTRALNERAPDEQLVGVLYLLGRAAEAQERRDEALSYYQRVFVLDIQFRDIADRISELERAAR
jgi:tetratricopeptide (TPR) repeat protein